jgi:peptide/nickel transport system permease protein
MLRYALGRIGQMVPIAFLVSVLIFLLIKLIPGDPASAILGDRATDASVAALRHQLGLGLPLWQQYVIYMRNLLTGNLGISLRFQSPVAEMLPARLAATFFLITFSLVLSVVIAVPLALVAAAYRDRWPDQIIRAAMALPLTTPSFWVGILLLILFALKLRWFPAVGYGSGFVDHVTHLFLPALTLSYTFASVLCRNLRSSLVDAMSTAYVDFARAKGLGRRVVLFRHVLRAGLLPAVTLIGTRLSFAIGGSVVIETVFAIPGLGSWMIDSINARDYVVVQTLTLMFAFGAMLINLATDLIYPLFDPRLRMG